MLNEELKPVWPIDVMPDTTRGVVVRVLPPPSNSPSGLLARASPKITAATTPTAGSWNPGASQNLEASLQMLNPLMKLISLDDTNITNRDSLEAVMQAGSIGEKFRAVMETIPVVGEAVERKEVEIQVATTIPLSEYKSLALIAAEDDQKMCKAPPPAKKPAGKK